MAAPSSGVKKSHLAIKNLHEYLKDLPSNVLEKLYLHPTTCLAIFRDLPDIAKHYVLRILFIEQPVPQAVIASWVTQPYAKEHLEVVSVLNDLKIWHEAGIPGGLAGWTLNSTFKKNLKVVLIGGGNASAIRANVTADSKAKSIDYLDKYGMERWECVLHYMVGSQQQEGISADAVRILHHAGLMKRDEEGSSITRDGFQFLLLDTASQVWYFMLQYLDTVEARGLDLVQCLNFLFQLSYSILGKDYSTEGMSEGLLTFLQHLREFGLVYQRKRKGGKFYPTRLAVNMVCDKTSLPTERKNGFLIVETNYRVYAYTDSNLQIALLGLFSELLYRFPNLCVAVLTRESIRMALKSGITSEQIINFLRAHVHPKVLANTSSPLLPPTIVDQIVLWEKERQRFTFTDGILYSQFVSQADFNTLRDFAQEINCLTWQNEKRRAMVINKNGQDEVKKFWKKVYKGSGQT